MPLPLPRRSPWPPLALLVLAIAAASAVATAPPAGAATVLAEIGPFSTYAVGHVPGGGYLVVWRDGPFDRLRLQRVSPAGFPVGPSKVVVELPEADSPALGTVAVSSTGDWAVLWTQPSGADQVGIGGAFFDAQDHLLGHVVYPDPIPDPAQVLTTGGPSAVALPGGGYAVAFGLGDVDPPEGDPLRPTHTRAYLMRVDRSGNLVGEEVQVSAGSVEFEGALDLATGGGRLAVLVHSTPADGSTSAIEVRLFDLALQPLSPAIPVATATQPDRIAAGDLVLGADGRFLVGWQQQDFDQARVWLRPYDAAGEVAGGTVAVEDEAPPGGFLPRLALTEQGVVWVSWLALETPGDVPLNRIVARPFDLAAAPLAGPVVVDTLFGGPHTMTGGVAGALVAWRPENDSPTLVGAVVGRAAGAGTPPPELALTSADLPGFRVWARFTGASGATRWGTAVEPCLAEALCVAGALPARAELIVRVVGPRPNGFLWPILAPLTVSRVEVWIQQLDGGAVRYYVLPGSEPPSELLPGLFDRDGFLP